MLLSCISYPVDGGNKVVRSTGTHLQTERHITEGLTLIPERRKNSINLRVKIFRREIYCEAGFICGRV